MTNTTTKPKTRVISITGRPPVRIREDDWPIIAKGKWDRHDGKTYSQANRTWSIGIRVRQHKHDGRAIVYGVYDYDSNFEKEPGELHRVGLLLDPGSNIATAIERVCQQLIDRISDREMFWHARVVADKCISNLPARDLD